MSRVEYLLGSQGPFFLDSDDPLWTDPRQLVCQRDMPLRTVLAIDASAGNQLVTLPAWGRVKVIKTDSSVNTITFETSVEGQSIAADAILKIQFERIELELIETIWW